MSRTLSTTDVARILGMKEARIRQLVRSGLCRPVHRGRRYAFSFQDLVVLRAAHGLLQRGVPAARVQRALATLVRELPADRPLSGLKIYADGRQVAVCAEGAAWQPETGQTLLHLEVDELAERVEAARVGRPAPEPAGPPEQRARLAFERALELDDDDPKAAAEAYRRALALDPGLTDALVNLGRILQEQGEARAAVPLCRRALEQSPEDPVIHFNLALALEDAGGPVVALPHYERALALDPTFADAHYNLAGLFEQLGRKADALRHYRAYQKLTS